MKDCNVLRYSSNQVLSIQRIRDFLWISFFSLFSTHIADTHTSTLSDCKADRARLKCKVKLISTACLETSFEMLTVTTLLFQLKRPQFGCWCCFFSYIALTSMANLNNAKNKILTKTKIMRKNFSTSCSILNVQRTWIVYGTSSRIGITA